MLEKIIDRPEMVGVVSLDIGLTTLLVAESPLVSWAIP
jgi:hypothetical protein